MSTVVAFHNDLTLRAEAIARMRTHAEADAIIQGDYIKPDPTAPTGYRGCFLGCLVTEIDPKTREMLAGAYYRSEPEYGWHAAAESLLGLPERFGYLAESIFEALPADEAPAFALALVAAIPAGVDLDRVVDHMMIAILNDPERGCRQHASPAGQDAIDTVVGLYQRTLAGEEPTRAEWSAARYAADDVDADGGEAQAGEIASCAAAMWPSATAEVASAAAWLADLSAARRWQADTLIALTAAALPAATR